MSVFMDDRGELASGGALGGRRQPRGVALASRRMLAEGKRSQNEAVSRAKSGRVAGGRLSGVTLMSRWTARRCWARPAIWLGIIMTALRYMDLSHTLRIMLLKTV